MPNEHPEAVLSDEERELIARNNRAGVTGSETQALGDFPSNNLTLEPPRRTNFSRLLGVLCSVVAACTAVAALLGERTPKTCPKMRTPECFGDAVLSSMDRSADPCSNFYEYACGSWLRKQRIPEDKTSYSRSFTRVAEDIRAKIREMLDKDLQVDTHPNAVAGRFYTACMRDYAKGPLDVSVLKPFVSSFQSLVDAQSFALVLAKLHSALSAALFDTDIGVDDKHPNRYAVFVSQGGLGLSHPHDYTVGKPNLVKMRAAYLVLIEGHLRAAAKAKLIPYTDFSHLAKSTFEFEKSLAFVHKLPEELRDPTKLYNPMNYSQFPQEMFVEKYMNAMGIDKNKINSTIVVTDPKYLTEIANIMARVKDSSSYRAAVKGYLAFHLVRHFAAHGMMGEELYNDEFNFKTVRSGVKKLSPRWKRCQGLTGSYVGDQLGQAFVKKLFPQESKMAADKLTGGILETFRTTLQGEDWMDAVTKKRAVEKLDAITRKIGYTKKFDTYPGMVIKKNTFSTNLLNAMNYAKNYEIGRLGKPVDKTEWFMAAYKVNAYYSPSRNEIVFPAGKFPNSLRVFGPSFPPFLPGALTLMNSMLRRYSSTTFLRGCVPRCHELRLHGHDYGFVSFSLFFHFFLEL